ncbi:MAG: hypothetical protein ACK5LL_01290 [Suipraeoptans sp.]
MSRVIILLLIAASVLFGIKYYMRPTPAQINPEWEQYLNMLTNLERSKWENDVQEDNGAYIQINSLVMVSKETGSANLKLINPRYSACDLKITITTEDALNIIYESEVISPGTIIEDININTSVLSKKKENVTVNYVFFDGKGNKLTERNTTIAFLISKN